MLATMVLIATAPSVSEHPPVHPEETATAETIELWRGLTFGDTPEEVAEKIRKMPEVRKVDVRRAKSSGEFKGLRIAYINEGINILGATFSLVPQFAGEKLSRVGLGTDHVCANDAIDRYASIYDVLATKYPDAEMATGRPSLGQFSNAESSATWEQPSLVTATLHSAKVAVMFNAAMYRVERPPVGILDNKLKRAISDYLWTEYRHVAESCNGTGTLKVRYLLTYFTKADMEAEFQKVRDKQDVSVSDAKEKL